MTRIEYELLRHQEPHLGLPLWCWLRSENIELVGKLSRQQLIASRAGKILAADWMDEKGFPHFDRNARLIPINLA